MKFITKKFSELATNELWLIYYLRVQVFVVEQECYYQEVDEDDKSATHLLGFDDDNNLIAYSRLIPEDNDIRIGRIVVSPNYRGHDHGKQLVAESIKTCQSEFPKLKQINIQTQAYLQKFYESFGFKPVSDVYLETGIPHLDMIKKNE